MPPLPVTTPLGYLGIIFLLAGSFLLVTGLGILKIDRLTVVPGRKTWGLGLFLGILGILFLLPDIGTTLTSNNNSLSNTPTPSECKLNNLINCSVPIPVFVPTDSNSAATFISDSLVVDFNNNPRNTSGVVFQFTPPLDVKGFNFLEISGTSTQAFTFLIEYKVRVGNQLNVVVTSTHQSFSAISTTFTVKIPISYGGSIDELAINFFEKGQSSTFVIESIRLK